MKETTKQRREQPELNSNDYLQIFTSSYYILRRHPKVEMMEERRGRKLVFVNLCAALRRGDSDHELL
jgi:hypothetical protein